MKRWFYVEFWWAVHNLIAHPLSQLIWWASLCGLILPLVKLGEMVHNWTIPVPDAEPGQMTGSNSPTRRQNP